MPDVLKPLSFRNAAEVRSGQDFHAHIDRLIRGIDRIKQEVFFSDNDAFDVQMSNSLQVQPLMLSVITDVICGPGHPPIFPERLIKWIASWKETSPKSSPLVDQMLEIAQMQMPGLGQPSHAFPMYPLLKWVWKTVADKNQHKKRKLLLEGYDLEIDPRDGRFVFHLRRLNPVEGRKA